MKPSMNPNFIVLSLCDNDYGSSLEKAATLLHESLGDDDIYVSERRVHEIVVRLMVALENLREAARGSSADKVFTEGYLSNALKVVFANKAPEDDHDGGSACIGRRTNHIWRY